MSAGYSLAGQTIEAVRRALASRFNAEGINSAELDARMLVGAVLNLDLTGLITAAARRVTATEAAQIAEASHAAASTVSPSRASSATRSSGD